MTECERPLLAEPGSTTSRRCGECVSCRGQQPDEVVIRLPFVQASRLAEMARHPIQHRAGDSAIALAVEQALSRTQERWRGRA